MRWWHSFSGVQRTTGETRTFFIEYQIMNPNLYQTASSSKKDNPFADQPILGQHPFFKKRGLKPSYVMIKAGVFPDEYGENGKQLNAFYPISSLRHTCSPFIMEVEDCFYSEDHIRGYLEISDSEAAHPFFFTDAGTIEWDLEVYKAVSCHTGIFSHPAAQTFNVLDSYWHGEGIKSFFRGTVILDGEVFDITADTSNGYADKHWGRSFNKPWFQLACGQLRSERTGKALRHSVLAINGCCPRFLFIPLRRKLQLQFTYTGEDYTYGIKPFLLTSCRWETKETGKRYIWHIIAKNKNSILKISGSCTKEQMLRMRYENPDGILTKKPLMTGAAMVGTIQLYRRHGKERELLDTLHMEDGLCFYKAE